MIVGGQKILVQVGNANRGSLANKTGWLEERQLGGLAGGLSRKYKFVSRVQRLSTNQCEAQNQLRVIRRRSGEKDVQKRMMERPMDVND